MFSAVDNRVPHQGIHKLERICAQCVVRSAQTVDEGFEEVGVVIQGGFDCAETLGRSAIFPRYMKRSRYDEDEESEGITDNVDERLGDREGDCLLHP